MCFCQGFNFLFSVDWKRFKGGAVVRALVSQDCGPGSNTGVDAMWRLSLLLVFSLAPRGFLLQVLRFSPFLETQHFLFPIRPRMADEEPLRKCATSKIVLYYLFILLTLFLLWDEFRIIIYPGFYHKLWKYALCFGLYHSVEFYAPSSSSSSSSSNSPSSSAVASWYCWYSDTRSCTLDSACKQNKTTGYIKTISG